MTDKYTEAQNLIVGNSPELNGVLFAAKITASSDVTVLIQGENGSGKELLARTIHQQSERRDCPIIEVNCAAIPENLAESLLFGHVKGAFTGAVSDQKGYVRSAQGGILFLDEIGELPLAIQAKLLRFLESGECLAVGSSVAEKIDVRVIVATNRDLRQQVEEGKFREDLYYRINIIPLELPPLRKRTGDVALLLNHFLSQLAEKHSMPAPAIDRAALKILRSYSWPGNVRELRNFCERMLILNAGQEIKVENLPREFFNTSKPVAKGLSIEIPDSGISIEAVEIHLIRQAIEKAAGNRSKAARLLGLTRDTLLYRIKKYAI